jgi:hypothetical protein
MNSNGGRQYRAGHLKRYDGARVDRAECSSQNAGSSKEAASRSRCGYAQTVRCRPLRAALMH